MKPGRLQNALKSFGRTSKCFKMLRPGAECPGRPAGPRRGSENDVAIGRKRRVPGAYWPKRRPKKQKSVHLPPGFREVDMESRLHYILYIVPQEWKRNRNRIPAIPFERRILVAKVVCGKNGRLSPKTNSGTIGAGPECQMLGCWAIKPSTDSNLTTLNPSSIHKYQNL